MSCDVRKFVLNISDGALFGTRVLVWIPEEETLGVDG
jgi:hypothetical protein